MKVVDGTVGWGGKTGHETDGFINQRGGDLIAVEINSGRTANKDYVNEIGYRKY